MLTSLLHILTFSVPLNDLLTYHELNILLIMPYFSKLFSEYYKMLLKCHTSHTLIWVLVVQFVMLLGNLQKIILICLKQDMRDDILWIILLQVSDSSLSVLCSTIWISYNSPTLPEPHTKQPHFAFPSMKIPSSLKLWAKLGSPTLQLLLPCILSQW